MKAVRDALELLLAVARRRDGSAPLPRRRKSSDSTSRPHGGCCRTSPIRALSNRRPGAAATGRARPQPICSPGAATGRNFTRLSPLPSPPSPENSGRMPHSRYGSAPDGPSSSPSTGRAARRRRNIRRASTTSTARRRGGCSSPWPPKPTGSTWSGNWEFRAERSGPRSAATGAGSPRRLPRSAAHVSFATAGTAPPPSTRRPCFCAEPIPPKPKPRCANSPASPARDSGPMPARSASAHCRARPCGAPPH